MVIISTLKVCEYRHSVYHPESPERIYKTYEFLKDKYKIIEPQPATKDDILLAHTEELHNAVLEGKFYDPDTPAEKDIYYYATLSAGGAILAMKYATKYKEAALSLMRPPGHHAGRNFLGGFCYFNNIAIAIRKFLSENNNRKAAILDLDCHHGNGTQDIFYGDKLLLYVSLHQSPLYPGTGLTSEDNCLNYPIPPNTSETLYLSILSEAIEEIKKFSPDILGVSLGFDTYINDPITNMNLTEASYNKIAHIIKENIIKNGIPTFYVLEGGYSEKLPELVYNFIKSLEE
jgi:acetoin utilization deacetylase AcuC-like enzyme